jgi:hypothetical protein
MKTKEEIEQLAFLEYPRLINDPYNPMEDDNTYERQIWIDAYTQCQEDNKSISKKLKLIEASINGSLDGIEFDNNSDVIEKSFVIDMLNELKKSLNKQY